MEELQAFMEVSMRLMHCDWAGGVRHDLKWLVGLAESLTVESTAGGSRCVQTPTLRPVSGGI